MNSNWSPSMRSLEVVADLEAMNVELDDDVMRIGPRTWAIHGRVAYDGAVIAATFASEDDARVALSRSSSISWLRGSQR
jgi:hypothetical protein